MQPWNSGSIETSLSGGESVELREYFEVLWRGKWILLLSGLIGLSLVLGYSAIRPERYVSTATVLVTPVAVDPTASSRPDLLVNLPTEREVIQSETIAADVVDALGLDAIPADLLANLQVAVVPDTQVLRVAFEAGNPEVAQAIAQAFSEQYLARRAEQATDAVQARQQSLQDRLDIAQQALAQANESLALNEPASPAFATAQSQRDLLMRQIEGLQGEAGNMAQLSLDPGAVIGPARLPAESSSGTALVTLLGGGLVGILAGIVAIFARDRVDDRIRGEADLRHLPAPVLGSVPNRRRLVGVGFIDQAGGPVAESYRRLATSVLALAQVEDARSFSVTSPAAGDGKTIFAANLAAALSQAGRRVLLVSADMRRPGLGKLLYLEDGPGLSTYLAGHEDWRDVQASHPLLPDLHVLLSGPLPEDPGDLLQTVRLQRLVTEATTEFDVVLFDAPPLLPVADALHLAAVVDGVILTARASKTRSRDLEACFRQLSRIRANIAGLALTNAPKGTLRSSTYGKTGRPHSRPVADAFSTDSGKHVNQPKTE